MIAYTMKRTLDEDRLLDKSYGHRLQCLARIAAGYAANRCSPEVAADLAVQTLDKLEGIRMAEVAARIELELARRRSFSARRSSSTTGRRHTGRQGQVVVQVGSRERMAMLEHAPRCWQRQAYASASIPPSVG